MKVRLSEDYTMSFNQHKIPKGEIIEICDIFPWSDFYVRQCEQEDGMIFSDLIKKDCCEEVVE